jgi:HEAT repeat protein
MELKAKPKRMVRPDVVSRAMAIASLPTNDKVQLERAVHRYLSDRSPRVRASAVDVVRKEQIRELEAEVIQLLNDTSSHVRYAAVECLGSLNEGRETPAPFLYPRLIDSHHLVRIESLESLALIQDSSALSLSLVADRLQDDDPLVRSYAAWCIAELDGRQYIEAIRSKAHTEQSDIAKVGYAEALFAFGDAEQFQTLVNFLSSPDYLIRCASANALGAAKLTSDQLRDVVKAVSFAAKNSLFRADRTTMERVQMELQV